MLNHNYIGTEHLLLGLIHEGEGIGARALESLGVTLNAVREQVQDIVGPGPQAPNGHIPFTPRAKRVFELRGRSAEDVAETTTAAWSEGRLVAPRPRHSTLSLEKLRATRFSPADADGRLVDYLTA